jgi:hypothetical protein
VFAGFHDKSSIAPMKATLNEPPPNYSPLTSQRAGGASARAYRCRAMNSAV